MRGGLPIAALVDAPDEVRGTALGPNVTSASFGWLGAAALGVWMLAQHGFAGSGPLPWKRRPSVWTAAPDAVAEKVRRGYHASASVGRLAG